MTYRTGTYWKHTDKIYILASTEWANRLFVKCALISIYDGNRWVEPVMVKSTSSITVSEMSKITGRNKFKQVKVQITEVK